MPPKFENVISHWQTSIEGFSTSIQDFYARVEAAVTARELPDVSFSRVHFRERGILSDKREYLRISRGNLNFDICAAPFGNGFFFSSWMATDQSKIVPLLYLFIALACTFSAAIFCLIFFPIYLGFILAPGAAVTTLVVLALCTQAGILGNGDTASAMPILGRWYAAFFGTETYFTIDTAGMFRGALHQAVLDAVDEVTSVSGKRALTEQERIPELLHR